MNGYDMRNLFSKYFVLFIFFALTVLNGPFFHGYLKQKVVRRKCEHRYVDNFCFYCAFILSQLVVYIVRLI